MNMVAILVLLALALALLSFLAKRGRIMRERSESEHKD